ncbi:MAG: asparagine synthase (glutamine-hydrolyzing) [Gemmatimonadetes bacterium]|nr:MAG: asparagine synthase (glutamine-hydrolyzing) [Gemmatimonadota bacterium]
MCGLGGVIDSALTGPASTGVEAAFDALARRGPDARHVWYEPPCTLLHTRLRILDTSARADQPMTRDGEERVVMVFNGEIYNYRALRAELAKKGAEFVTASDSEVLLAGFQSWGEEVFVRAQGMWAVAFWQPRGQRLTLARDPLGKKPLAYYETNNRMVFASSVAAVLALIGDVPEIDRDAIACYLGNLVVPHEHSVFRGVQKVPPGSLVSWSPGRMAEVRRYWSPPVLSPRIVPLPDAVLEVERMLRVAVRRRLESDVPLGVFLSAGYDSGIVAAIAAEESGRPLLAVTAGTTGSVHDERNAAAQLARRYGLTHRALEVPAMSAASLPFLMSQIGEPFGDSSILPSFEVAQAARREITVALTGDGGDEAFFGYPTFRGVHLASYYRNLIPGFVREALWKFTRRSATHDWRRRLTALLEYGAGPLPESFRNRMGFAPSQRARLLRLGRANTGHQAEHIYADRLRQWSQVPDADALRRTLYETYLPNDYLVKVDSATMSASLEARCPFLDVELVEFTLSLPQSVAFPGARLKGLLKPLAARVLPPELRSRPKTGFSVPIDEWLRGSLRPALEEFVFRKHGVMSELIDVRVARSFCEAHARGADHGTRLWALLALGVWCAVVLERRWSPAEPLPLSHSVSVRSS